MGTYTSAAALSRRFEDLARTVDRSKKAGVTEAAFDVKELMEKQASASGLKPGSSKLAGTTWRGVRYDVKGSANPTALVRALRPAHLHNNDVSQHFIGARKLGTKGNLSKKSRRVGANIAFGGSNRGQFGSLRNVKRGKQALTIGANLRAYAFHPGTRGKGWWGKGERKAGDVAIKAYRDAMRRALRSFR